MQRPIPPSNFKSTDGNVREDLRRMRVFLEQLEKYIDAGDNGRLTQTVADLLYLKRAAADYGTFATKAAPTAFDRLLIEDAAAGFAKKAILIGTLPTGGGGGGANSSYPLYYSPLDRGVLPGALDDEFNSTTLDPSWIFRDTTTGPTIRTPTVGAINELVAFSGATAVPRVQLHTQGRRSWMQVQLTSTGSALYQVYKPFTWAAGQFYWCRLGALDFPRINAIPTFNIWASLAGVPDNNNRCQIYLDRGAAGNAAVITTFTSNAGFNSTSTVATTTWGIPEYWGIANPAGVNGASSTWYAEAFWEDGKRIMPWLPGAAPLCAFVPAFIGWQMRQDVIDDLIGVDFIRENAGHPLFHL